MNKKKEIVPKLRFPEFIGDKLKITKLGKISSVIKEKAGENKYILMSVTSGVGLIPQAEKFGREIAGDSYKNYIVIRKYDFAYNKSATKQFPEGYISMLGEYDIAAVPNSIFTCFRITGNESYPPFFDYLWHNNYHGHWLRKYIEVGARAHGALSVDTKHLWGMPLALPDFKEQQKIADCLSSIDDLIDAESRKLKALEKYKKGLMQKLFPAEGKTLPEWRFPECKNTYEIKRKRLADVCYYKSSALTTNDVKMDGKYNLYDANKIIGKVNIYASEDRYITIIKDGAGVGRVRLMDGYTNFVGTMGMINNNEFVTIDYLYYLLQTIDFRVYAIGGTIPHIYFKDYSKKEIFLPHIGEQQKITDCLSEIDTIITEQSNKVEQLKIHKKGLMQGLFPSLEEADV
ncbi:restriction endonuclease subunit S [Campylobacter coli]|nr:restriction endonuclease subunit S [Campylobacter coli]